MNERKKTGIKWLGKKRLGEGSLKLLDGQHAEQGGETTTTGKTPTNLREIRKEQEGGGLTSQTCCKSSKEEKG